MNVVPQFLPTFLQTSSEFSFLLLILLLSWHLANICIHANDQTFDWHFPAHKIIPIRMLQPILQKAAPLLSPSQEVWRLVAVTLLLSNCLTPWWRWWMRFASLLFIYLLFHFCRAITAALIFDQRCSNDRLLHIMWCQRACLMACIDLLSLALSWAEMLVLFEEVNIFCCFKDFFNIQGNVLPPMDTFGHYWSLLNDSVVIVCPKKIISHLFVTFNSQNIKKKAFTFPGWICFCLQWLSF